MEKHIINGMAVLNCQVCSEGTEQEALDWINITNPPGTTRNEWVTSNEKGSKPIQCEKYKERKHYIFFC